MAEQEYTERFTPGHDVTFAVGDDVRAGRVVEVTGNRQIAETSGASAKVAGVAAEDRKAGGDVVVKHGKWHDLIASGAITAGDRVASAAGGTVATATQNTIGLAIEGAADGATALIRLDQ